MDYDSRCFQVESFEDLSDPDCAHIVSLFLPVSKAHDIDLRRRIGHSSTVTLHEALTFHLGNISESVQDRLLDMLSSFNDDLPATLPSCYRLLYKAAQFALRYLSDEYWASYRDAGSCRHLELLSKVLWALYDEYNTIAKEHPYFLAPILELLRATVDDTSICDYDAAGLQHPELRDLFDQTLSAISVLLRRMVSSRQPEFVFPSFRRLSQVLAHYRSSEQGPLTFSAFKTLDLMRTALEIGNEGMYQAFIDGGWLPMLAESYIVDPDLTYHQPILACIEGLQALDPASALKVLDYLQQPRNFIITFSMIAFWRPKSEHLLKLCPKKSSSWDTHRATLDAIIDWCQASNHDDLPFPLENFFERKVVQTDKVAVFLVEALRKMFADNYVRDNLKWGARTIILGKAAPRPPSIYNTYLP